MIIKRISKKILISTVALVVVALVYFFPNASDEEFYEQNIEYVEANKDAIYLKDNNNYIARTNIIMKEEDVNKKIVEIISSLTIDGDKKDYIPTGFHALIPKNTKILSQDLDNGLLKLNFSKEMLNVTLEDEEGMIEAIVYSLTEISSIKRIMIFVEGNLLTRLPNSNKKIPKYLTRDYGINKIYDLSTISNSTVTTIYYLAKYNDKHYYVPVSTFSNDKTNKIEIVINSLKTNPIYQSNLLSYMVSSVELLSFEENEDIATLNFNTYILDDFDAKTISEEVKYTILLSLRDNLGVQEVIFNVNNEKIDQLTIEN